MIGEDLDMILGKVHEILKISDGVTQTIGELSQGIDGDELSLSLYQDQEQSQHLRHEEHQNSDP